MYYNPYLYRTIPLPPYPIQTVAPHFRSYPPVDTKIFEGSVKSFHLLMQQGSVLLDRLGDAQFSHKMMSAAQQGKKAEVDQLIKTIGLKVPVVTQFTPSGVHFILSTQPQPTQNQPESCCTLTVAMKWGY
ncbi:hypothetical protein [Neobacillus jeddahensis]|uniref:hypothetical protein n=1 Tax=Neobacillus jeddahensis TaxID=1461580 RepID=UPI00069486DA|nr:hypothetical protein [Neobacillus jeddahensis]